MERPYIFEFVELISEGGAETLVRQYCIKLKSLGYKPIALVYHLNPSSSNEKILFESKIPILPIFPKWNLFYRLINKFFHNIYIYYKLKKIFSEYPPAVVHIHSRQLSDIKLVSKSLVGVRIVYTCHSLPERYFLGNNILEYKAAKYLIKHNDLQLVGLHNQMKDELNKMFNVENTAVVKNGVDFDALQNVEKTKAEIRSELGIPVSAFVIGNIGRFIYIKNQKFIVDLFADILKIRPNSFLLLVGDGEDINEIRALIEKKSLTNKALILSHRSDIPLLLHSMDVFFFPSLFEGMPMTLIEAQVSGLRCVCSDQINQEAFISRNLVSLSLTDSHEKWISCLLDDKRDKSDRGLLESAKSFSMESVICELLNVYSNITQQPD